MLKGRLRLGSLQTRQKPYQRLARWATHRSRQPPAWEPRGLLPYWVSPQCHRVQEPSTMSLNAGWLNWPSKGHVVSDKLKQRERMSRSWHGRGRWGEGRRSTARGSLVWSRAKKRRIELKDRAKWKHGQLDKKAGVRQRVSSSKGLSGRHQPGRWHRRRLCPGRKGVLKSILPRAPFPPWRPGARAPRRMVGYNKRCTCTVLCVWGGGGDAFGVW